MNNQRIELLRSRHESLFTRPCQHHCATIVDVSFLTPSKRRVHLSNNHRWVAPLAPPPLWRSRHATDSEETLPPEGGIVALDKGLSLSARSGSGARATPGSPVHLDDEGRGDDAASAPIPSGAFQWPLSPVPRLPTLLRYSHKVANVLFDSVLPVGAPAGRFHFSADL